VNLAFIATKPVGVCADRGGERVKGLGGGVYVPVAMAGSNWAKKGWESVVTPREPWMAQVCSER